MHNDILRLLKTQDCAAIEQLYDAYGGALYGVVLRIVSSKDLAQYVIQDTFLKAWRYGADYDESKGRLYTWLLKIARNTAIDATRTAHFFNIKKTDDIDHSLHILAAKSLNPDTLGLRDLVQKMDEKHKTLIDLVYFNGYTQREASEEAGVPIGTVKTRLRYAILLLRETFEQSVNSAGHTLLS